MGILSKLFGKQDLMTDVLKILESQHADVDALFAKIENGDGNRRALFTQLADKLAAHATVEEKLFYPAVMARETDDLLHESVEEHLSIKRILADLIAMNVDDEEFMPKIQVLKEQVTHHAHEEEEKKLFPKVAEMFDAEQRAGLGNELLAMFEELLPQHPYKNVPAETETAAPLPSPR